jgi:NAD(P)-dependent dehydrogenase (short-subunit alcohol dehydrogenase family)
MSDSPVALITGASSGIGRTSALTLSKRGYRVFIGCRNKQKADAVLKELRAASPTGFGELLELELGDFDSVRACAKEFLSRGLPLNVLLNNAGVAGQRGLTRSGWELHFGTNHLGHFLLTQLLLPKLRESAPSRVVAVSSETSYMAKAIPWDDLRKSTPHFTGMAEYAVSKLCNILHTRELSKREAGKVAGYSVHPGRVMTLAWRRMPSPVMFFLKRTMLTDEQGCVSSVHAATAPDLEPGTFFWEDAVPRKPNKLALDESLAAELWKKSEEWTK